MSRMNQIKAKSKRVGIKKVEFTKVKLNMARITNVDLKIVEGNQVKGVIFKKTNITHS